MCVSFSLQQVTNWNKSSFFISYELDTKSLSPLPLAVSEPRSGGLKVPRRSAEICGNPKIGKTRPDWCLFGRTPSRLRWRGGVVGAWAHPTIGRWIRVMAYGCDLTRVFTYDGSEKDSLINCETKLLLYVIRSRCEVLSLLITLLPCCPAATYLASHA